MNAHRAKGIGHRVIKDNNSFFYFSLPYALGPLLFTVFFTGCGQDMRDQPRFEPFEKTSFYSDGRSSRPRIEGTVARGQLDTGDPLHSGKVNSQYALTFPFEIDEKKMLRGQERYNIFCSVCHDQIGNGHGMIVQRGFPKPTSFHEERLRSASPGYLFTVITNGLGNMPPYEGSISPEDRWAIVAYLRVLQQSQNTPLSEIPPSAQHQLMEQSAHEL